MEESCSILSQISPALLSCSMPTLDAPLVADKEETLIDSNDEEICVKEQLPYLNKTYTWFSKSVIEPTYSIDEFKYTPFKKRTPSKFKSNDLPFS